MNNANVEFTDKWGMVHRFSIYFDYGRNGYEVNDLDRLTQCFIPSQVAQKIGEMEKGPQHE